MGSKLRIDYNATIKIKHTFRRKQSGESRKQDSEILIKLKDSGFEIHGNSRGPKEKLRRHHPGKPTRSARRQAPAASRQAPAAKRQPPGARHQAPDAKRQTRAQDTDERRKCQTQAKDASTRHSRKTRMPDARAKSGDAGRGRQQTRTKGADTRRQTRTRGADEKRGR